MSELLGDLCFVDFSDLDVGQVKSCPYHATWSLEPMLAVSTDLNDDERSWLESLEETLAKLPQTRDQSVPPLPGEDIVRLVRMFFPPFKSTFKLGALLLPLSPREVMVTPSWYELLVSGILEFGDQQRHLQSVTVRAGMLILNQHYAQVLNQNFNAVVDYRQADTGLVNSLTIIPGYDFVKVEVNGELPKLSRASIRKLLSNPDDEELWLTMLPVDVFSFKGIEINHIIDTTALVSQNKLQRLLLKREAVLSERRIQQMTDVLRNYLLVPDLTLGIMALDYPLDKAVAHRYLIRQDLLSGEVDNMLDSNLGNTIYRKTCENGTVRIFDDLKGASDSEGVLIGKLLSKGYRSLVLVPLFGKGEHIIGMIELASAKSFAFNNLVLYQLDSITPLFRQAVRRSRDDMEARLQAVLRTTFTALDPSVEWRFVQAAAEIIEAEQAGETEEGDDVGHIIEPIRFEDVWALYAQADIVSSSHIRNEAIGEDLLTELTAARNLLSNPAVDLRFPLAGKLVYDIDELTTKINEGLSPNDEQSVLEFMQYSFEPTLQQLRDSDAMMRHVVAYEADVAKARPKGFSKREAYERSVRKVTSVINGVISSAQREAQRIVPHYFSKYRTDGVEFNIYAGQSLLQHGTFSEIHLQNLRLWQLQCMVDVTKATAGIRDKLETPMSTAQLILAFGNQITLQFRMDEKRFDVEGAYNVRYEVIKKRIDKALIRGTEERLTIADHIAIVYSHHSDRRMYHELIDYLHGIGEVKGEVEDLELEPMQGVDGLFALRVRVL